MPVNEFPAEFRADAVRTVVEYQAFHNVSLSAAFDAVASAKKCSPKTLARWFKAHTAATSTIRTFGIKELVAELGVTSRALRFYEEVGLIKPARRGQTRLFSEADRETIIKIIHLRDLGFSIAEIQRDGFDLDKDLDRLKATQDKLLERHKLLERSSSRVRRALAAIADD